MEIKNFIKTNDKATADEMFALGYKCVSDENGFWTFINDMKNKQFSSDKITFTNKLEI